MMKVIMDDTPEDTLMLKFWRDQLPHYKGDDAPWICQIGINIVEGVGGSGATPLEAMRDLCEQISRHEGFRTDNGRWLLR